MASKNLMDFEKAIEYMDPMQVTDYLQKTWDFLQRNNNEMYFPSISPYVEAFLVNLVTDTRNLMTDSFKSEDRKLASEIIEFLEVSRDVFRWTHSYENGNLLVYKKIFSNKIKKSPKPSSIAHRLHQAQTQQSTPPVSPTMGQHALETISQLPDIPATSTRFKLQFLSKTLRFIKDDTEFTLNYDEMPLDLAEYLYSLIKYQDKEVGFGYKSLYAPLWEAMDEYSVDYTFEVTLEENSRDSAVLTIKKVPKNNKSKRKKEEIPENINNDVNGQNTEETSENSSTKSKQEPNNQNQSVNRPLNITTPDFPQLELLSNIDERFFKDAVVALIDFADDQARASVMFQELSEEEIAFVKRVKTLAESSKVRKMFAPIYRDLLWRLNYSIKEVMDTCKITAYVNEKDRSIITLKKTPSIDTTTASLPVPQQTVPTGASSKTLTTAKTRDRSVSKDRIIQFQKGGKLPGAGDSASNTENDATKENQQEPGRSRDGMSKRRAKLLEDLSTPLESDRGMRMMLLMGWNGGALGARGNGIMEPVMPNIEQPIRGGLGHVPPPKPPKVTPRRSLDFRLRFLHSVHELLLHEGSRKEIQFKERLVSKETKFVKAAISCMNKRRCLSLTERENELFSLIVGELAGKPGVLVRQDFSSDFKTISLNIVIIQPIETPKKKRVKKRAEVITITDDDVDVLITEDDVWSVMPYIDIKQMNVVAHPKNIRKRAIRLLVLTKFAEVLNWHCQFRIVFKFDFMITKKLKSFMQTIIESLNNGDRLHLVGWETQVYEDLWEMVRGSTLTWEKIPGSKYVLRRTPSINEDSLPNAGRNLPDNNNDNKTGNRNQIINVDDCTEQIDYECNEENDNKFENNNEKLVQGITCMNINNLTDTTSNIDFNNKDDHVTGKCNETDRSATTIKGRNNTENIVVTIKNNTAPYIRVKDVDRINAEIDSYNSNQNGNLEAAAAVIKTECDMAGPCVKESGITVNSEVNNNVVNEEAKTKVPDLIKLSDWDRDIQNLDMTILNVDLDCVMKVKHDSDGDLVVASSETDLNINVEEDKDIDQQNSKRAHSSSVCSQELGPKKVKICCETDEQLVIIAPKNQDEGITHERVKQVHTLMSNQLDKAGGFLPLLKCHGVQNGGLIYSCHDEDDVAWLKKVVTAGNLDVVIASCDHFCSENKTREMLIRINSYIPLDPRRLFRKFELYNVGLDTKYWKVTYKHTSTTFVMFIVTVDEKSFKYISDEKFSLYCGIDKAQFSVIC